MSKKKKSGSKPKKKKKGILKKIGKGLLAASTGGVSLLADKKIRKKIKGSKFLKKVGQGVLAVSTGGVSLLATKKGKAALKKVGKKLKNVHPLKVLKNVANKIGNAATFVTLLPLMGAMLIALKKKGIKVPHKGNAKEVANLFYINIVKKQHLEHCEDMGNDGNILYRHASNLYKNSLEGRENLIEEAASGIITAILNFFTGKKKQAAAEEAQKNGEDVDPENELTDDERAVVDTSEPLTEDDYAMNEEVDNATDELAAQTGGVDSDGNVNIPEESLEDEMQHCEHLESDYEPSGIMKFFGK